MMRLLAVLLYGLKMLTVCSDDRVVFRSLI